MTYDFTRKGGVEGARLVLPGGRTEERAAFWNRIEAHHKRGDAVLAREVEVALPSQLSAEERKRLAFDYARELADRYGVAVDAAVHAPRTITDRELEKNPDQYCEIDPKTGRRHNGNWHAHVMLSACTVTPAGDLGKKAVELDPIHCQRHKLQNMADRERSRWAELANERLKAAGVAQRIDHRSLEAQGIDREPTQHLGHAVAGMERRGVRTEVGWRVQQEASDRLARAAELGRIERERKEILRSIIDISTGLRAALSEREQRDADRAEVRASQRQVYEAREQAERAKQLEPQRELAVERKRLAQLEPKQERDDGPDTSL